MTPLLFRALTIAALSVALVGGAYFKGRSAGAASVQAKWDAQTAQLEREALEQSQENRRIETKHASRTQEIDHDATVQLDTARAVAARARAAYDSLRDELTAVRTGAAATAADAARSADEIATLARQLSECSSQLQSVADRADAAAVQVMGLQEFVKAEREP